MNTSLPKLRPLSGPLIKLLIPVVIITFIVLFVLLIHLALGEVHLGADFYTFWLAGRSALHGQDPYSAHVTLQSQMGIYGRAAQPGEDEVAFAYPPYSLLILLPGLPLPFDWAYAVWLSVNIIIWLTLMYFLFSKAPRILSISAILLYPVFICFVTGNFSVFISGIVLFFFGIFALRNTPSPGLQVLSAALIAWSSAKPQFMWLITIFILLYALKARLYPFLIAFFASLALYTGISFVLIPGWVGEWLFRVQQYAGYVKSRPTVIEFLLPFMNETMAWWLTAALFIAGIALTFRLMLDWWQGKRSWMQIFAWAGMFTYLFHLHGMAYEQMAFLTPLALWTGQQPIKARHPATWTPALFWFGSIVFSWIAFSGGMNNTAIDRSPVLLNAVWVIWMLRGKREKFQV